MIPGPLSDDPEDVENGLIQAHLLIGRHDLKGARDLLNSLTEQYPDSADLEDELRKVDAALKARGERITVWRRLIMCLPEAHGLLFFGLVAMGFGLFELCSVWPAFQHNGINGTTVMHGRYGNTYTVPLKPYLELSMVLIVVGAASLVASLIADRDEVTD